MISFDIFDTLITRTVWEPSGLFLLIQKRLEDVRYETRFSDYIRNNYALLRKNAEIHARKMAAYAGKEEVVLDEIYEVFARMAQASAEIVEEVKQLEIRMEAENSVPVCRNIALLKKYLSRKEKVVLISDMYLPKEAVGRLLEKADPALGTLPLYISCEYGKTKYSGSLYAQVKKEQNIDYSGWTHYGDHAISDVKIPQMLGIKAVSVKLAGGFGTQGFPGADKISGEAVLQLFLGVSRNVIENHSLRDTQKIGASFGGWLLYPYVDWIVHTSAESGYDRLFFIARDGFVLKKIADEIIAAGHYKIETKYLYGSRKAWRAEEKNGQELLCRYLRQEIGFADDRCAFVDLQGTGCSMEAVFRQLKKIGAAAVNVFYFQMFLSKEVQGCNFMPFCVWDSNVLLEPFARAPHGAAVGYCERRGRIEPVLEESSEEIWEKCGLPGYLYGVELFAKGLADVTRRLDLAGASLAAVSWALSHIKDFPPPELLAFIGDMPHSSTQDDGQSVYAPALSKKDIFNLFMWKTTEEIPEMYRGSDLEFSLKRIRTALEIRKAFYEKHYFDMWGFLLHKVKYLGSRKVNLGIYRRIVIYAAGLAGKELYCYITFQTASRVVGWTDINFRDLKKRGVPVAAPKEVFALDYDVIIVAFKDVHACGRVKELLVSRGIAEEKILGVDEFYKQVKGSQGG